MNRCWYGFENISSPLKSVDRGNLDYPPLEDQQKSRYLFTFQVQLFTVMIEFLYHECLSS